LAEHARHLKKRFTHWVGLTVPAIKGNAPNDAQAQMLVSDYVNQLTKLLCTSSKSRDFKSNDCVTFTGPLKHDSLLFFDLAIAVFVFQKNFLGSSRL
jgi:hypothetical protein